MACRIFYYSNVTWALWRLKSPTTRPFDEHLQVDKKGNIIPYCWPFVSVIHLNNYIIYITCSANWSPCKGNSAIDFPNVSEVTVAKVGKMDRHRIKTKHHKAQTLCISYRKQQNTLQGCHMSVTAYQITGNFNLGKYRKNITALRYWRIPFTKSLVMRKVFPWHDVIMTW